MVTSVNKYNYKLQLKTRLDLYIHILYELYTQYVCIQYAMIYR